MTAATEPHAIVASTVSKIEQGNITRNDIEELRKAIRQNPEAIPFLDRSFLNGSTDTPPPSGTVIVRYVGMVQDMLDAEYYLSEINGIKTHYRDVALSGELQDEDDVDVAHKLSERQPLVVVPLPFTSEWLRQKYSMTNNARNDDGQQNAVMESNRALNKRQAETISYPPIKRKALGTPDTSMDDDSVMEEYDASPSHPRDSLPSNNNADWWPAGCMKSDPNHCPILAKLYYEQDVNPRLRLNEVVELVGVLSIDPTHADFSQQSGEELDDFCIMTLPPPSLLPRLHVLCYNRVNLEQVGVQNNTTGVDESNNDERTFAIQFLTKHVFDGNTIAAEALLMTLMSMAEREDVGNDTWAPIKTPFDTTLGCASFNLILSSEASCQEMSNRIQRVLQQLLPVVALVDLSRDKLGKTVVSPAKNESGRLDPPSILQLPRGSALVINESLLDEGRIEARAEETLRALASLTQSHSVPYRFEGIMNYQFEGDYRVIVMSKASGTNGSKLLPCTLVMKLSDDIVPEKSQVIPVEDSERVRSYLALCRCNTQVEPQDVCNVALPRMLLEHAQKYFIEKRAECRNKTEQQKRMQAMAVDGNVPPLGSIEEEVGEADFHRWLTMARLQARSRLSGGAIEGADEGITWADTIRLDEAMKS